MSLDWSTATIAISGTSTSEIDLGAECSHVQLVIPALDSCTLKVTVSPITGGTFTDLGDGITTSTTTGSYTTVFKIGRFRYIKIVSSVAQSAARTFQVRGVQYNG